MIDINKFYYDLDEINRSGDAGKAVEFVQSAIETARKEHDQRALIAIYNEAGGLFRDFSKYDEACRCYDSALAEIEDLGALNSESHGTTLINYGTCLGNMKRYDEAFDMFSHASTILVNLNMASDYRMAALYNNLSWTCQALGHDDDAADYLNKALLLLKAIPDSDGEQAASYTNLANLYWSKGMLEEAQVTLIKAVDIYKERADLRTEGRYAAAISALANIYYSEAKYEKAAALCREAMAELEKEFGRNDAYHVVEENLHEAEKKITV